MLHVLTVHYHSDRWIDIQRRYLDRFAGEPFTLYGSLEGVEEPLHDRFDVVVPSAGGHPGKLNLLARVASERAEPDDVLVFLDGDAFPVADMAGPVHRALATHPLSAVCRLENGGDRQPHPCFCAVTVATWAEIRGDWCQGHLIAEKRTDVGANLLYILESLGIEWDRILRSNRTELHPVLFGVYGGFLYHHGAGFRELVLTRGDRKRTPLQEEQHRRASERLEQKLGKDGVEAMVTRALEQEQLSEEVYRRICADPDFFRDFV